MLKGDGQTLLSKIASLPLYFFVDEKGRAVLFPTLIAICFRCPENMEALRNELSLAPVTKFLQMQITATQSSIGQQPASPLVGGAGPPSSTPNPPSTPSGTGGGMFSTIFGVSVSGSPSTTAVETAGTVSSTSFGARFPLAYWQEALEYFTESSA